VLLLLPPAENSFSPRRPSSLGAATIQLHPAAGSHINRVADAQA
jgi:hypothetical protein